MKIACLSDVHVKPIGQTLLRPNPDDIAAYLQSRLDTDIDMLMLVGDIIGLWAGKSYFDKTILWNTLKNQYPGWFEWLERSIATGRVVYISGNHDRAVLRDGLLKPVYPEVTLVDNNKRIHFEHGHQADWFNSRGSVIGRTVTWFGGMLSRIPWVDKERLWGLFSDKFTAGRYQSVSKVRRHYLDEARNNGWDVTVIGHTHHKEIVTNAMGRVYANCGTWIRKSEFPIVIINDGVVYLEHVRV